MTPAEITPVEAVVFDLDGVLVDSEAVWDDVRERFTEENGGRWHEDAQRDMMGMSSLEWSRYMHETLGVPMNPEEISALVAQRLLGGDIPGGDRAAGRPAAGGGMPRGVPVSPRRGRAGARAPPPMAARPRVVFEPA